MSDAAEVPPGFKPFRDAGAFAAHIGPIYYCKLGEERFVYGFRAGPQHLNPDGIVHGGMLFSFADQFLGRVVAAETHRHAATVKLNVEYLAPGRPGDWIEGRAESLRVTRDVAFLRAAVHTARHTLMTAQGIWRLLDPY